MEVHFCIFLKLYKFDLEWWDTQRYFRRHHPTQRKNMERCKNGVPELSGSLMFSTERRERNICIVWLMTHREREKGRSRDLCAIISDPITKRSHTQDWDCEGSDDHNRTSTKRRETRHRQRGMSCYTKGCSKDRKNWLWMEGQKTERVLGVKRRSVCWVVCWLLPGLEAFQAVLTRATYISVCRLWPVIQTWSGKE